MKITFVDIQNFRKLESCRIEFDKKKTLFVGANNSGKTSAMDALIYFLKHQDKLKTTDITLSHWKVLEKIAEGWLMDEAAIPEIQELEPYLPSMDVWLEVEPAEFQYVHSIIPSLEWDRSSIGVRLRYEPDKLEELFLSFREARQQADSTKTQANSTLSLWPKNLQDFLDKKAKPFVIRAYKLDPDIYNSPSPSVLPTEAEPLDSFPFQTIFKIDIINAQRGFSDVNTSDGPSKSSSIHRLSDQLRDYHDKHLSPLDSPRASDIKALEAIQQAQQAFDTELKRQFESPIKELENLGYPGFSDPHITLSTRVNPMDGLSHDSSIQFGLGENMQLPERYNGLGYQNLISMIFKLMRFRDAWMRTGKKQLRFDDDANPIEPIHLVLIEEPEAHLHAQIQQVFIKKAYGVLRKHEDLGEDSLYTTQLVISTHSSHLAHAVPFSNLRYFQRKKADQTNKKVPTASVVSLANTFGDHEDTERFVTRYLYTTHSDLFFADGIILVEGPAERMLIPHFIHHHHQALESLYITQLEIGGSHAHKLRPLIEKLGVPTLVITDLDSIGPAGDNAKVRPLRSKNYRTGNDTLKTWHPVENGLDNLLDLSNDEKVTQSGNVRVAYQHPITLDAETEVLPYTFEDAMVFSNLDFFKREESAKGLLGKMNKAIVDNPTNYDAVAEGLYQALDVGSKKAEMALELFYHKDGNELTPPQYISEGLAWLQELLTAQRNGL